MKQYHGLAAVLLALALLLSACAGGAGTAEAPEIAPAAAETPAEAEPVPAAEPENGPEPEPEQEKTDEELAAYFSAPEHMYLLDLSLPLLEEGYVDAETAACARSAALSLKRWARDAALAEAVLDDPAGDSPELVEAKNAWLDAIGAAEDYTPFAPLRFERSTALDADLYPFLIRTPYANWYFLARDVQEQGYVDFISSYLEFAPVAELDFADAQACLKGYIAGDTPPVRISVGFSQTQSNSSWFSARFEYVDNEHNRIHLYHGWDSAAYSLLHEYVHYLRREDDLPSAFCTEAITEEISTFECENRLRRLDDSGRENRDEYRALGAWDEENDCLDYRMYEMLVAENYSMGYGGTYVSVAHYAVSHPQKMSWNYLSYEEGACMARYMTDLYGKDALLACSTNEDLDRLIGKPVDEFYNDFLDWLDIQCFGHRR